MKRINNCILGLLFASSSMFTMSAVAVTPDGQTPAEETVCSPLKADGISKGLYGLCVAFCEAHDFADASVPITEEDFNNLEAQAPSGKILANYNKRKQPLDPAMPCIAVEDPCPCITADELAKIDGTWNGIDGTTSCWGTETTNAVGVNETVDASLGQITVTNSTCQYWENQDTTPYLNRILSLTAETVTAEQLALCKVKVQDHCAQFAP